MDESTTDTQIFIPSSDMPRFARRMGFWLAVFGISEGVFLSGYDWSQPFRWSLSNETNYIALFTTQVIFAVSLGLFSAFSLYQFGKRSQVIIDEKRITWRIPPWRSRSITWSQINRIHVKRKPNGEIRLIRLGSTGRTRMNLFRFVDMPLLLSGIREKCQSEVRFTETQGVDLDSHVSFAAMSLGTFLIFNAAFLGIVYI